MKKYIKAAYDKSIPDWLRPNNQITKDLLLHLGYRYAMSDAKFYREPQPNSQPIHLLYEIYVDESSYKTKADEFVYAPGFNDQNGYIESNGRFRSLANSAKSKIAQHIVDTVYMVAPLLDDARKGRDYVDPRYLRDHWRGYGRNLRYGGQTPEYESRWNGDTRRWEPAKKVRDWVTVSGRDKSGYVIPQPEELYARLYERFPNRIQSKLDKVKSILDEYYDKIDAAKNKIFAQYDIRKGHGIPMGGTYDNVIYYLNEAIRKYGAMYSGFERCINEDGSVDTDKLAEYMNGDSYDGMQNIIKAIDNILGKLYSKF